MSEISGDKDKPEQGDSSAREPEQDGPFKKRSFLENALFPANDQNLTPVEIIGRCSVCNTTGTIDYPRNTIPARDIDKLLAYKPVKCFCPNCHKNTEFLPIEVKKYPDVPFLKTLQKGFKKGDIR